MTVKVLALVGPAMAAAAPASANETFKDWWVACDNTRECAAFGFAGEAFEMSGYLKVARGAHAAEAAQAKLVMEGPPGPWALSVDGKALATVTAASEDGDGRAAAALTPAQSAAVLAAAANGKALQVAAAGKPIGAISLAGSSAALRTDAIDIDGSQLGEGYGLPTPAMLEAVRLLARCEGLLVDPVYSGKALAGLLSDLRQGRYQAGDNLLFVMTGGTPGLYAYRDIFSGH